MVSGFEGLDSGLPVLGISVRQNSEKQIDAVWKLVRETAEKLKIEKIKRGKILVDDRYVGKGYTIPSDGTIEAITLLAQTEGILLDPVFFWKRHGRIN